LRGEEDGRKEERRGGEKMRRMKFVVRKVKECLVREGKVFSVRKWGGVSKESVVFVEDVGVCEKRCVKRIERKEELEEFVGLSGLRSVNEWWKWCVKFGCGEGGWLWEVKVVKREKGGLELWL
jgi:hypothetical protein